MYDMMSCFKIILNACSKKLLCLFSRLVMHN